MPEIEIPDLGDPDDEDFGRQILDVPVAEVGMLPQFMTIVLLFGAAVFGANRDERKALRECREMLKNEAPLAEVAQAIMDARGPEWEVPAVTMEAIEALHDPSK